MYEVITFGSATQDIFLLSRKFELVKNKKFITQKGLCVPLGTKLHMEKVFFAMGGCGVNAAVTFARQGFKTAYVGAVGPDCAGELVKNTLKKEKVSLNFLKTVSRHTALSIIISLPKAGRSILEYLGASHYLRKKDIPFSKISAKWFYVGALSGPSSKVFPEVINYAKKKKIYLAVNPGRTQLTEGKKVLKSLLKEIDLLLLNLEEAARLTDLKITQEEKILDKLSQWAKGIVVITKGKDGVVVSDKEKIYRAGIPKSDLVDRTGAGDAFGSAFLAGWIRKKDIVYAIQLGTANATACLQKLGAAEGLLKKGEWGKWPRVKVKITN